MRAFVRRRQTGDPPKAGGLPSTRSANSAEGNPARGVKQYVRMKPMGTFLIFKSEK